MNISIEHLRTEREALKEELRALDAAQRHIEKELKLIRQKELRAKRKLEALTTLIDLEEAAAEEPAQED